MDGLTMVIAENYGLEVIR
nr:hypothetical protein [Limosilactobacillus vaginalis]